jgi:hypothetical protein
MILKLIAQKVQVIPMKVSELIKETSIHYEFEKNTEHLHPVLYIAGKMYKGNHIVIELPDITNDVIPFIVELHHDNGNVIHVYKSELAYNKYQITGTKPVHVTFEKYIHELELENIDLIEEIAYCLKRIKELEEKGELV